MEGVTVGPNLVNTESNSRTSFIELLPLPCRPLQHQLTTSSPACAANNPRQADQLSSVQQQHHHQGHPPSQSQWRLATPAYFQSNDDSLSNSVFSNHSVLRGSNSVLLLDGNPLLIPVGTASTSATVFTTLEQSIPAGTAKDLSRKNKGGWQRGKRRRRPHPRLKTPAQPSSAYVIFAKKHRPFVQASNPSLSFCEITKVVGKQWSSMSQQDKGEYYALAEQDKKRYKEELQSYQKSAEYKAFVAEKAQELVSETLIDSELDLYCAPCDSHFLTFHNKEEHLNSAAHRKNVIGPFEAFLTKKAKAEKCCSCSNGNEMLVPDTASVEELQEYLQEKDDEKKEEIESLRKRCITLVSRIKQRKIVAVSLEHTLHNATRTKTSLIQDNSVMEKRIERLLNLGGLYPVQGD